MPEKPGVNYDSEFALFELWIACFKYLHYLHFVWYTHSHNLLTNWAFQWGKNCNFYVNKRKIRHSNVYVLDFSSPSQRCLDSSAVDLSLRNAWLTTAIIHGSSPRKGSGNYLSFHDWKIVRIHIFLSRWIPFTLKNVDIWIKASLPISD